MLFRFNSVKIGEPSIPRDGVSEKITPQLCRLSDMTYALFSPHAYLIYCAIEGNAVSSLLTVNLSAVVLNSQDLMKQMEGWYIWQGLYKQS